MEIQYLDIVVEPEGDDWSVYLFFNETDKFLLFDEIDTREQAVIIAGIARESILLFITKTKGITALDVSDN